MVKFDGKVVFEGKIVSASICDNWHDSMGEYYPYISVIIMQDGKPKSERVRDVDCGNNPYGAQLKLEVTVDDDMVLEHKAYLNSKEAERLKHLADIEAATPRRDKIVEVFKGRKIPKGTIGKVFWYGDSGYGFSVGIELENGARQFTSASNVRVINGTAQI